MTQRLLAPIAALALASLLPMSHASEPTFLNWAPTPPMGWNSWDCFATTVTEQQTLEQAQFMADKLKAHGWQYVVVDIQWYEPDAKDHGYRKDAVLTMDAYGRLQPAANRFPSAADGSGFTKLAGQVHALGLKFGIHLMRGIPRQAVEQNLPILGTKFRAADIADKVHVCPWNPDMYGVDMSKPGAQEYYDSVFALIASWGVDYIKVDDLSRPYFQNQPEIEAIRKAIDKTGRPMVLSLSPGATDIKAADHVTTHANLWRISDDFWDRWLALKEQFWRLAQWNSHRQPGAWPDADMLPLGTLVMGTRETRFTKAEQCTLMTLWSIARSPLMHGGDLTKTDAATLALLTNDEVLAVNQHSTENREVLNRDGLVAWSAKDPATGDTYLALFNARDPYNLDATAAAQAPVILTNTIESQLHIDADTRGAARVFLVAEPTVQSDGFTPLVWEDARFVMEDGSERFLRDLKWVQADAQWDSASTKPGKGNQKGDPMALAAAVLEYEVPAGALRLKGTAHIVHEGASADSVPVKTWVVIPSATTQAETEIQAEIPLSLLGLGDRMQVRDLWTHEDLGQLEHSVKMSIPSHGARLFRLSPAQK